MKDRSVPKGAAVPALLMMILALAPVPLGSNRPWSWSLLAAIIALTLLVWMVQQLRAPTARRVPWPVWVAGLLVGTVGLWALMQTLTATTQAWPAIAHPFWLSARAAGLTEALPMAGLGAEAGRDALMRLLAYAGMFWLALMAAQESAWARRLLVAVVVVATACALYGLVSWFLDWPTIFGYVKTTYRSDVTGTFVNRNSFATYVNVGLIACLALMAEPFLANAEEGEPRRLLVRVIEQLLIRRLWLLMATAVLATAVLQSHSRGGLLSGAVGVVVLVLTVFLTTRPRPLTAVATIATVLLLGWGILFVSGETTLARLDVIDSEADVEGAGRFAMWDASLQLIAARPWTGHGYGNFMQAFETVRDQRFQLQVDKAHNTYLEHAVELGVPATILLYLAPLLLAGYCLRGVFVRRRGQLFPLAALAATVVVALHALVDFSLQIPAVAVTYATVLGIGVAQARPSSRQPRPGASLRE